MINFFSITAKTNACRDLLQTPGAAVVFCLRSFFLVCKVLHVFALEGVGKSIVD